jgi:hypothetical protein
MYRPIDPLSFVFNPALGSAGNVDLAQPAVYDAWGRSYGLRLTWQVNAKNKVSLYGAHQPNEQIPQFLSGTRSYEASNFRDSPISRLIQASWKSPITSRFLVEAAFMGPYNSLGEAISVPWITPATVSVNDTGTGLTYRAAPTYWEAYYNQPSAKIAAAYVTGAHAAKVGFDFGWGWVLNRNQRTNAGMNYGLVNGVPRSINLVLSPRDQREGYHWLAFYGQDQWTLKRLTVNAGLRFDYHNQSVADQVSGPGPFVPFQEWPAVDDVVGWKDVSPRLGIAYDLFGNGRTAVKGTISRYNVRDNTAFAAANNPLLFNATATRSWGDANRDFVPQETELGPLSNPRFGTDAATTRADPAISHGWSVRPYNWEVMAGVQHQLFQGASASVAYVRRSYGNFVVTDNLAISPSDYSEYCITTPTDARLPTSGSRLCGLYDLTPTAFVRTPDNLRTQASDYGERTETFNGVDVAVTLRFSRRVELFGGVSTGTSNNSGNALVNSSEACFIIDSPQALLYCDVNYPWRTQAKVLGTVVLPWEIDLGLTFQSLPGPDIGASYTVNSSQVQFIDPGRTTLSAGTATVPLVEPATMFGPRYQQVDVRVAKAFRFRGVRLRAILDVGNVMNSSAVLLQNNTYGVNWLRPSYIMPGRLFKPTLEMRF